MTTNMKHAQELVFGELGASNFKMFPGSNREVAAEEIARQVSTSIEQIASGEAEEFFIV